MQVAENPKVTKLITNHLIDMYHLVDRREGIHISSLIGCLTRSFFDTSEGKIDPTPEELQLFALGYALQDVITPKKALTPLIQLEGITYRPDFTIKMTKTDFYEIKTTRMSQNKGDNFDFPEAWLEYMKGGCFMSNRNDYDLAVWFLMGNYKPPFPTIKGYHFTFDDDELNDNWDYITQRKFIYESCLADGTPPAPYKWNKEYECKNCRYKLVCDTLSMRNLGR